MRKKQPAKKAYRFDQKEQDKFILEAILRGETYARLCRIFNISENKIRRIARDAGIKRSAIHPHERDEEIAKRVQMHCAIGDSLEVISTIEGVSIDVLRKYYQNDINLGRAKGDSTLAQRAFKASETDNQMLRFLCRVRLRWRDRDEVVEQPKIIIHRNYQQNVGNGDLLPANDGDPLNG